MSSVTNLTEFHIVLHNPVIPQNTGSIARLCACTDVTLHLIHPLGFQVDAARVRRAGLDYWPHVRVKEHLSWQKFLDTEQPLRSELFFFSKFAKRLHTQVNYPKKSYLVFGSETKGLPDSFHQEYREQFVLVPIRTEIVRSLNLAQCAAIGIYEVLRQHEFERVISDHEEGHFHSLSQSPMG